MSLHLKDCRKNPQTNVLPMNVFLYRKYVVPESNEIDIRVWDMVCSFDDRFLSIIRVHALFLNFRRNPHTHLSIWDMHIGLIQSLYAKDMYYGKGNIFLDQYILRGAKNIFIIF